jgi:hypothetical protein
MSCSIRARSSFISTGLSSRRVPNVPCYLCLFHSFASLGTLTSTLEMAEGNNMDARYEDTSGHFGSVVVLTRGMIIQAGISIV